MESTQFSCFGHKEVALHEKWVVSPLLDRVSLNLSTNLTVQFSKGLIKVQKADVLTETNYSFKFTYGMTMTFVSTELDGFVQAQSFLSI